MKAHIALSAALFVATPAAAQTHAIGPHPSSLWLPAPTTQRPTSDGGLLGDGSKDYRYEGFWGGGIALGLLSGAVAGGLCNDSDSSDHRSCLGSTIGGAILGFLVGAPFGALVGGVLPKGGPVTPPS
ncbi:MAG: hypothetical protein WBC97_06450 [Gemmatimonadales bacterium]